MRIRYNTGVMTSTQTSWSFRTSSAPREVFAVMEQMIGTPPYRFEVVKDDEARIVQFEKRTFVGRWKTGVVPAHQVSCTARVVEDGTHVTVTSSRDGASRSRAQQLVELFERAVGDPRTYYRDRNIPLGPVTLVASWAGTPYVLYTEPRFDAPRRGNMYTATKVMAIEVMEGAFCKVKLPSGETGFAEKDQIVPVPVHDTAGAHYVSAVENAVVRSTADNQ